MVPTISLQIYIMPILKLLTTIKNVTNLLKDFEDFHDKNVIFARDFNLNFDKNFESTKGNRLLKKHSLSEIIKLKETFNLCDMQVLHFFLKEFG